MTLCETFRLHFVAFPGSDALAWAYDATGNSYQFNYRSGRQT